MSKKEAQARIKINKLLELADWRFFPDAKGPDNIICEHRTVKKVYSPSTEFGDDFEKAPNGFIDYPRMFCCTPLNVPRVQCWVQQFSLSDFVAFRHGFKF